MPLGFSLDAQFRIVECANSASPERCVSLRGGGFNLAELRDKGERMNSATDSKSADEFKNSGLINHTFTHPQSSAGGESFGEATEHEDPRLKSGWLSREVKSDEDNSENAA